MFKKRKSPWIRLLVGTHLSQGPNKQEKNINRKILSYRPPK